MASLIKGPAIFLAQFAGDAAPFNSFGGMCKWASSLGYKGVQIPTWVDSLIDIGKAAESQTYCDELSGTAKAAWRRDHRAREPRPGSAHRGKPGL